jgi:hypothetical protein
MRMVGRVDVSVTCEGRRQERRDMKRERRGETSREGCHMEYMDMGVIGMSDIDTTLVGRCSKEGREVLLLPDC